MAQQSEARSPSEARPLGAKRRTDLEITYGFPRFERCKCLQSKVAQNGRLEHFLRRSWETHPSRPPVALLRLALLRLALLRLALLRLALLQLAQPTPQGGAKHRVTAGFPRFELGKCLQSQVAQNGRLEHFLRRSWVIPCPPLGFFLD
jgi:hypothetical protein